MNIFDKIEPPVDILRAKIVDFVNPIGGILKNVNQSIGLNDEPPLFYCSVEMPTISILSERSCETDHVLTSCSFDRNKALVKSIGEGIERYSLSILERRRMIYRKKFSEIEGIATDPRVFDSFTSAQRKRLIKKYGNKFEINENSIFNWVRVFSLFERKYTYIPSQLLYAPYRFEIYEPIIRIPISTGAASGMSYCGAVYRGICEVIERDAFVLYWINKIPPKEIIIKESWFEKIKNLYNQFNLEIRIFDITTDIGIPVFMALIFDYSSEGYPLSIGLKCGLNFHEIVIGAIEEAQQTRPWCRYVVFTSKNRKPQFPIKTLKDRILFWSKRQRIKYLKFLFEGKKCKRYRYPKINNLFNKLNILLKNLRKSKIKLYVGDVTTDDIKKNGFKVVKVIMPQLQPLWLDEEFKYLGNARIKEFPAQLGYAPILNKVPHPFL